VRDWQLWNEPSLTRYWSDRPWEADYAALVRASRAAVRQVDPAARIVLAGFPNESWDALEAVYDAAGRGAFDVVAVHPFTARVAGVETIVRRNRRVMRRHGDGRKPIMVTETSWSSTLGPGKPFANERFNPPWQTTERGQAVKVRRVLRLLARERRRLGIERAYWFTWLTNERERGDAFDYSGLRRLTPDGRLRTKPALRAYRSMALDLRSCRRTSRADRCGR
jgi:arabinogalactan endo-1,4-beta-galactosidase